MNRQIRQLYVVVLIMFAMLGLILSYNQVIAAPALKAHPGNTRTIYAATTIDRGPIIVAGTPIATSIKEDATKSRRYQRVYENGTLYAPVTGYFSDTNASTGLENAAESILEGDTRALLGQRLLNLFTGQKRKGGGINLTINPDLQRTAAEQLGNRRGAVVVLDVKTGAIRALYSSPSFDPNPLASFDSDVFNTAFNELTNNPAHPLTNRAIAGDRYAPASTAKILTSIALLEKEQVTPQTRVEAPTSINLPGTETPVVNVDGSACGDGQPTFQEAFARSCNTPFVGLSTKITAEDLLSVAERFGFGRDLSIPIPVTPSYFPDKMDQSQTALAAIGQYTVQATPLQMAMVAQGIAARGTVMRPHLIASIVDADLQVQETTQPREYSAAITPEIAQQVAAMMRDVVTQPYGTGSELNSSSIAIAAKTGTAEVGDGSGRAHGWTVGFAPYDDPQLAFAVLVEGDDDNPVAFGSHVAAPIARALMEVGIR